MALEVAPNFLVPTWHMSVTNAVLYQLVSFLDGFNSCFSFIVIFTQNHNFTHGPPLGHSKFPLLNPIRKSKLSIWRNSNFPKGPPLLHSHFSMLNPIRKIPFSISSSKPKTLQMAYKHRKSTFWKFVKIWNFHMVPPLFTLISPC